MAPFLAKQIISNGKQKGMTGRREAALHFLGVEARRRERATRSRSTGALPPVHRQAVLHFHQPRGAGPWRLMSSAAMAASLSSRLRPRPQKSSQPPGPFELSESWSSTFSCASTRSKVVTRDDSRYVLCGDAPMSPSGSSPKPCIRMEGSGMRVFRLEGSGRRPCASLIRL